MLIIFAKTTDFSILLVRYMKAVTLVMNMVSNIPYGSS